MIAEGTAVGGGSIAVDRTEETVASIVSATVGASKLSLRAALREAEERPSEWISALDAVAERLNAAGAILIPSDPRLHGAWLPASESIRSVVDEYWRSGLYGLDPRVRLLGSADDGAIISDISLNRADRLAANRFYDKLAKLGLGEFVGMPISVGGAPWILSAIRAAGASPITESTLRMAAQLRPQIEASANISLRSAKSRLDDFMGVFDQLGRGLILLNTQGEIVRRNRTAASSQLEIFNENGNVKLGDPAATSTLNRLLDQRRRGKATGQRPETTQVDASRGHLFEFFEPPDGIDHFSLAPAALISINPGPSDSQSRSDVLTHLGLSPREAEIARELSCGKTVREIAHGGGVAEGTVRQQLKSIFRKLSVTRQADLVRLVDRIGGSASNR